MDSYQAIYDATRSKISGFNGEAMATDIVRQFDFSHQAGLVTDDFRFTAWQMRRPSVLFRPSIIVDGNQWCALYGEDLQSGVAGFGDSPELAMLDFDKNWEKRL